MMNNISVAFIIPVLCGGGAERVIVDLANAFAESGDTSSLISFRGNTPEAYEVAPEVTRLYIEDAAPMDLERDEPWERENILRLRGALYATSCDIAVSFLPRMNMRTLLAARGIEIPTIVSERVDPRRMPLSETEEALRRELYPEAAALVVQTERIAREWGRPLMTRGKVEVIPNMIRHLPLSGGETPFPQPYVAAAGRLAEQKGFDLLVDAFAEVAEKSPDLSLVIAGEGEDREKLLRQATDRGIADRVLFPGFLPNLGILFGQARMVVLSSRFEGFPNVLMEAMALGKPVIATDCPTGPREIIRHGEDGLLVENENTQALAEAIYQLNRSATLRDRLGKMALKNIHNFSPAAIQAQWASLIASILGRQV